MKELVLLLEKRRIFTMVIVVVLAILAVLISLSFTITPTTYFEGQYNQAFIYGLIVYKLIELPILYYLLLFRHIKAIKSNVYSDVFLIKLKKHIKLLFFLIPQGNTIFGIIAFKLSGNVTYFLLFSAIALITIFLIKPNKLDV